MQEGTFQWALSAMQKGDFITRPCYIHSTRIFLHSINGDDLEEWEIDIGASKPKRFFVEDERVFSNEDILAKDWQIYNLKRENI